MSSLPTGASRFMADAPPAVLSERAERELVGFRAGMAHRWWMAGSLLVVLAIPILTGIFRVGIGVLVAIMASSFALNGLLLWATSRADRWRPTYRYLIPLLDVATLSLVQFAFGNYGLVAVYMFAVTAYTLLVDAALGYYATALSVLGFGIAGWAHIATRGGSTDDYVWLLVVMAVYTIAVLKTLPVVAKLSRRIAHTRECLREVEQGNLRRRAPAEVGDELGQLERSLNATLDEVSRIIAAVQNEAGEVAAIAEEIASSSQDLSGTGEEFSGSVRALSTHLHEQRGFTEAGSRRTEDARAALSVANGDCEAGFAFDAMVDNILIEEGQLEEGALKVVWESEVIAGSPVAMSTELPAAFQEELRTLFTEFINTPTLVENGYCDSEDTCGITDENAYGYAVVDDAFYDGVRAVCEGTQADACRSAQLWPTTWSASRASPRCSLRRRRWTTSSCVSPGVSCSCCWVSPDPASPPCCAT